jgi:CBS domain-containing protein
MRTHERMNAGIVMTTGAATVKPNTPLADAGRIMLEHHISGLPVVDDAGTLIGIVTERDFLRVDKRSRPRWLDVLLDEARSREVTRKLQAYKVSDVMTNDPVAVHIETPVEDVLHLLEEYNIRRVPVLSGEGAVVGIVSRADLLKALMRAA